MITIWRSGLRLAWWLMLIMVTAGCTAVPELPDTMFRSPVVAPEGRVYRYFFPFWCQQGSTKRGLGLTYGHCEDVQAARVAWYYTWGPRPPSCPGAEAVSMIWGLEPQYWAVPAGASVILGFNEPDWQANIEACAAVEPWQRIEHRWPDARLISPAPSDQDPRWLERWYNCFTARVGRPPRLDGIAWHCYRPTAAECISLGQYYIGLARAWGVDEVWLTEFGFLPCQHWHGAGDLDNALRQAEILVDWLEAEPMVSRYAWFAARIAEDEWWSFPPGCSTALFSLQGTPTAFGAWYKER